MTNEVEKYRAMPMAGKWEYAGRLAAAEDLLPREFYGPKDAPPAKQRVLPGKVFLVIEYGAMLGLPALAAINGIHIIEGKPSMSAAMMSGLVRTAGHKLRVQTSGTVEGGDFQATATLIRSDDPDWPITATWTPHRALRAELLDSYAPDARGKWVARRRSRSGNALNWEMYTETMCQWRAISEACRLGADDVFMGGAYTPEEIGELPAEVSANREAEQLEAIERATSAHEAEALFRSWSNEGALASDKVAAAAMGRVATLTAEETARAAQSPADVPTEQAPDEGPAGPGEEIAEPVTDDAAEEPEAAQSHTEPEPEEPELDADEVLAQKLMPPEEFATWLTARRQSGATS